MLDWFQNVFSTPSEQGRLFTALVSVLLAVFVLLLNQYFANKRERKKILMGKVEELYLTSLDYLEACDQLITDIQKSKFRCEAGYYRNDEVAYAKMVNSVTKIEMLCDLYFPQVKFVAKDYSVTKMPLIWAANSGQLARGEVDGDTVLKESRDYISSSSNSLKILCGNLMKSKRV